VKVQSPRSRFYDGRVYARILDPLLSRLHDRVADHVDATGRILDVGCGTGNLVWRLAAKAREVVGVELSPAMVAHARKTLAARGLPHVSFVLGDVTSVFADAPDGHFDLATMVLVLHEMPDEARRPTLAEVTRLARKVVCVDFHAPMPWNVAGLRNRLIEMTAGAEHYRAFRSFQRLGGMAGAARAAGLRFETVRRIDAGTMAVGTVSRSG
jgi:ubiquinone/menaquinone biosynthesis C-methylase UbiE